MNDTDTIYSASLELVRIAEVIKKPDPDEDHGLGLILRRSNELATIVEQLQDVIHDLQAVSNSIADRSFSLRLLHHDPRELGFYSRSLDFDSAWSMIGLTESDVANDED